MELGVAVNEPVAVLLRVDQAATHRHFKPSCHLLRPLAAHLQRAWEASLQLLLELLVLGAVASGSAVEHGDAERLGHGGGGGGGCAEGRSRPRGGSPTFLPHPRLVFGEPPGDCPSPPV